MTLAIDGSTPAVATTTGTAATTVSFTPPANSLLLVLWDGNGPTTLAPANPTITDSLATHLTYTSQEINKYNTPAVGSSAQVAIWTATVATSAAMTVTVTGASSNNALSVVVLTDSGSVPTIGVHGSSGRNTAGTTTSFSFTATAAGSWGFGGITDWNATGTMTAGTGCTMVAAGSVGAGQISYGNVRRTTADGVSGSSTTLATTLAASSSDLRWSWIEIIGTAAAAAQIPELVMVQPGGR